MEINNSEVLCRIRFDSKLSCVCTSTFGFEHTTRLLAQKRSYHKCLLRNELIFLHTVHNIFKSEHGNDVFLDIKTIRYW